MTLCLALLSSDCILVAADGRAVMVDPSGIPATSDTTKKIIELSGGCAMLASGVADLLMAEETQEKNLEVDGWARSISSSARMHHQTILRDYQNSLMRPGVVGLVVGYKGQEPMFLSFSSAANFVVTRIHESYAAIGSMGLAHYFLRRFYTQKMSLEHVASLACYCILETSFQNPHVGGEVQLAYVRPGEDLRFAEYSELSRYQENAKRIVEAQQTFMQRVITPAVDREIMQ